MNESWSGSFLSGIFSNLRFSPLEHVSAARLQRSISTSPKSSGCEAAWTPEDKLEGSLQSTFQGKKLGFLKSYLVKFDPDLFKTCPIMSNLCFFDILQCPSRDGSRPRRPRLPEQRSPLQHGGQALRKLGADAALQSPTTSDTGIVRNFMKRLSIGKRKRRKQMKENDD